ncbi:MAG: proline--tRNA ligase [Actinobacteria bacterium]|nr:proline--tRNA ligase [Actinomycetota bacterium]
MRFSRVTVPTLKEKPAEAQIPSHELLLRAGMMRAVAAGIYTMLPLGALALQRVEDIVRREMNAAGALEVVLPTLHPADPWMKSGRWHQYGPEMMRLGDRQGRDFCLGPTAEELITEAVAKTAPSYRDLPVNLYQIQTKFRDETRPRFGLIRGREFRMKDAYSFHVDEGDLDRTYDRMRQAYSSVARGCSLPVRVVEAVTGLIGGDVSHEFMVVSGIGEDVLVYCGDCDYGADAELESHSPGGMFGGTEAAAPQEVHTPGLVSVEEVASFLGTGPASVTKCVLYVAGGEAVAVFVPGYREVSETKLARVLGTDEFHPMREDEREKFPAVTAGYTGPVGLEGVRTVFDLEIAGARGLICGANRPDYHLGGVEEGRDFAAEPAFDVATAVQGDACVRCGGELRIARGIEIGHIFKLGVKYSEAMGASFTDRDGKDKPMIMGTYGIGTSRILATVVEQHHDDGGIKWPVSVAPLPVEVLVISPGRREQAEAAERLTRALAGRGMEILVDDREASPGVKFNDADLVGLPLQVVIGKKLDSDGTVDLKVRYTGERRAVRVELAVEEIERALEEAP